MFKFNPSTGKLDLVNDKIPKKTFDCLASVSIGDLVYQDTSQVNTVATATDNNAPSQVIGIVVGKPTTTTAVVQIGGAYSQTLPQGSVFVSPTGTLQTGLPVTGKLQRMGFSTGDGTICLNPEKTRITRC